MVRGRETEIASIGFYAWEHRDIGLLPTRDDISMFDDASVFRGAAYWCYAAAAAAGFELNPFVCPCYEDRAGGERTAYGMPTRYDYLIDNRASKINHPSRTVSRVRSWASDP